MQTKQQLIEDNMNLVYFVIRKYYPTFIHDEDIVQCGMLGLCRAAELWKPEKSKFSTYATRAIVNEICREFQQRFKHANVLSLDTTRRVRNEEFGTLADSVVGDADVDFVDYDSFYETLKPMDKQIVDYKLSGLSSKMIAEKMKCSATNIDSHLRRIKAKWRKINGD